MTKHVRRCVTLSAVLAIVGLLVAAGIGQAGGGKGPKDEVRKIAAAIEKGDQESADSQAKAAAKKIDEVGDVMHMFKPRTKGGLGVGATPGVTKADGIELELRELNRNGPTNIGKEGPALQQAGYDTAAVARITKFMAPEKDQGKKKRSDWNRWADEMGDAGLKLAEAAKAGSAADVKTAATKVNNSCNSCHSVFRE